MERFILRFCGEGQKPAEDVRRIRSLPGARILDDSPRMILIEAPHAKITEVMKCLPHWSLSKEDYIPVPDPRPKLRNYGGK
jgi:hypothetical protein